MQTADILTRLHQLEEERNIKILLAVESGSRAWGCASPDSDYDVRIIYLHQPDWYLSIERRKDSIDFFEGALLDVNGWDIRKTLSLLSGSNATPLEWAQSPIVYTEVEGFRQELLGLARQYFRPLNTLNHYRGIAHNSLEVKEGEETKLKKMFYVIRPVLAALWIARKGTAPPMHLGGLLDVCKDSAIKAMVLQLIEEKKTLDEDYRYVPDTRLVTYLRGALLEVSTTDLPKQHAPDKAPLNQFFRQLLLNTHWS